MLLAALAELNVEVVDLGIASDQTDDLRRKVQAGLDCDVLLTSGGVSMGEFACC